MARSFKIFFLALMIGLQCKAQERDFVVKLRDKYGPAIDSLTTHTRAGDSAAFFSLLKKKTLLAKKENIPFLLSYCYEKTGIWHYYNGTSKFVHMYFDSAIAVAEKAGLIELTGSFLMNKGSVHYMQRDFTESIQYFRKSEEIMEKGKSENLAMLYGNMALLYQEIGDLEGAKKYLSRSFPFAKMKKEKDSYAKAINNLGLIFKKEGNFKAADSMYRMGYELTKKYELHDDFADVAYNLVSLLTLNKKYEEAKTLNLELLECVKKHKDESWVKQVKQNMAQIYYNLHDIPNTKKYLNESEAIKINSEDMDEDDVNSLLVVANIYFHLGINDKAAKMYADYHELNDKLGKEKKLMDAAQLSFKYEKHRDSVQTAKEKEIAELENLREQEKAESKLRTQRIFIIVSVIVFVLVIGFVLQLVKANRSKEKANKEISYQKSLLSEKNKEITDSITYAQRIQQSLLPPQDMLDILLPNHFLLYMPKDIVSGDFFWAKKINANELFVAVADCTGHGVPGAMMSALSIQNLNELAGQTRSPGELLSLLNSNLKNTLNQDQEGFSKDGLDICLCKINVKERKIVYSGANRNLQVFASSGLKTELKATKTGIGGHTHVDQVYEENEMQLDADDMIVMSTDGFADQFGGPDGKKITTKRFKEWLTNITSAENKKDELVKRFTSWKGSGDQIDDVCVLGFKI